MNNFTQAPISHRAQNLTVLGSLVLLSVVVLLVKRGYLKSGYSILWFLISFLILILSVFNNLLLWFSKITGIDYAPALIFSILIIGIILILIHFSVVISKHERRIKKLAQENALLKSGLKRQKDNK